MNRNLKDAFCSNAIYTCKQCQALGFKGRLDNEKVLVNIFCSKCPNTWIVCLPCQMQLSRSNNSNRHLISNIHLRQISVADLDSESRNQSADTEQFGQLTVPPDAAVYHSLLKCHDCDEIGLKTGSNNSQLPMHHIRCSKCSNSWKVCLPCQRKLGTEKSWKQHVKSKFHLKHTGQAIMSKDYNRVEIAVPRIEQQSEDCEQLLPSDETCSLTGLGEGTGNERHCLDPHSGSINTETSPPSSRGIEQETTFEHDWMLSTQGPRSSDQVDKEALVGVFGKDSTSPSFYHYESTNPGMGAHFLVASAFQIAQPKSISDDEVKFCLNTTALLSRLTEHERKQLANIMFDAVNANNPQKNIFNTIRLPTSTEDFNHIFVSGRRSILQNIPRPVVQTTPDKTHAYVSLIDVIANMMAANVPIDRFDETTSSPASTLAAKLVTKQEGAGLCSTRAAHALLIELKEGSAEGEYTAYLYCKEWSDDFDPSHSKDNRNQVWMKTYTICQPMESSTPDKGRHTAVISLGSKCDDHEEMESLITEQLRQLGTGEGKTFYHGGLNRLIKMKAGVLSTCVDRPERTKMYSVGDHNGSYSVCWGYAAHVDPKRQQNCLPSCPFCRNKRVYQYHEQVAIETASSSSNYPIHKRSGEIHASPTNDDLDRSTKRRGQVNPHQNMNNLNHKESAGPTPGGSSAHGKTGLNNTNGNRFKKACPIGNRTKKKDDNDSSSWDDSSCNSSSRESVESHTSIPPIQQSAVHHQSLTGYCLSGKCSSWHILDPNFTFPVPKDYPRKYHKGANAPAPPVGREIEDAAGKPILRLQSVRLTLEWLEQAALFAYHQMSTKPRGGRGNQRYWNKGGCLAYLRTCGIVKRLSEAIYLAGKDGEPCPIPTTWKRSCSLEKNHFAGMHMLFLGHGKSNIVMRSKWMSENELLAKFGRQANLVLRKVAGLRLRRFAAHPLSTSSWGTGPWVSENYVFEMRCTKYFMTMPAIYKCKKRDKIEFETDYRVVMRFVSASLACIGAIMGCTGESGQPIRSLVPIYLDCMVEMDDLLTKHRLKKSKKGNDDGPNEPGGVVDPVDTTENMDRASCDEESDFSNHDSGGVRNSAKAKNKKGAGNRGKKYNPNFVKSNSLGLLAVAEAHEFFGPVALNWEGAYSGERKIQTVKPELGIKRSNVAWQAIVIDGLYKSDGIAWLLERLNPPGEATQCRAITDLYRVFKDTKEMREAVSTNQPLAAVIASGQLFLLYRPKESDLTECGQSKSGGRIGRSTIWLAPLEFDDNCGQEIAGCWFAPISFARGQPDIIGIGSLEELHKVVQVRCLLLPLVCDQPDHICFENMYYGIADNWTERKKSGAFTSYPLDGQLFSDWDDGRVGYDNI